MISVVIPVGPHEANKRWLDQCIASVLAQTQAAAEIVLIDDMAGLDVDELEGVYGMPPLTIWRSPWLLGVAHAFNIGVAIAQNEHVVMLGSDDELQPWALADCWAEWRRNHDPLGYYWMDVEYQDTGETQAVACNAAMVTKTLWRHTGGFPVQSAVGAPDTMLCSILLGQKGKAGTLYRVQSKRPPYRHRRHPDADTNRNYARFESSIFQVRDTLTRDWQRPEWGRYD